MAIDVVDKGKGNSFEASASCRADTNGSVRFFGSNSRVILRGAKYTGNLQLDVRNGSVVEIGKHCELGRLIVHADKGSEVIIADRAAFNGRVRLLLHEKAKISIGSGCLFGGDVDVTVSDMHSIVDSNGKRINPARDIKFHDRVWVGQRTTVLKGVEIGEGSVIGTGSIVTKSVPAYCIAAGNPAKVVKRSVSWEFELLKK